MAHFGVVLCLRVLACCQAPHTRYALHAATNRNQDVKCCGLQVFWTSVVLCYRISLLSTMLYTALFAATTVATATVTTVHTTDSVDDVPAYTGA
eukprot:18702-Heterococcus_DN1.PRE.7